MFRVQETMISDVQFRPVRSGVILFVMEGS